MTDKNTGLENLRRADRLVAELVAGGVRLFCASPGARSAPLAVAAARHPGAELVVHPDERGAAFFALGWAKAANLPTALLCTSGTAAANCLPAVVEAAMAHVPLVVLTADRPPELLRRGANQAIRQQDLFGDYPKTSVTLPCPDDPAPEAHTAGVAAHALHLAQRSPAGPVHLNCMFREPLLPEPEETPAWTPLEEVPQTVWHRAEETVDDATEAWLLEHLSNVRHGALVVGALDSPGETAAALALARALQWPVLADITSGLRLGAHGAPLVAHYDQMLLSNRFQEAFTPECVLHLGGPLVSKRLLAHLARVRPEYITVAGHGENQDPACLVRHRLDVDVASFCHWLAPPAKFFPKALWAEPLCTLSANVADGIAEWHAGQDGLTESGVALELSRACPADSLLFLGNSMPVRDMDMYGAARDGAGPRVLANRGASGIDGCVASALGAARGAGLPTTALLGDLAALHDLNSLLLARETSMPFRLVVVNNDGGGIFSFLPASKHKDHFEKCFAAPHGLRFGYAARMFGWAHEAPDTPEALRDLLSAAPSKGPQLVEVRTGRAENLSAHGALQQMLAARVEASLAEMGGL